MNSPMENQRYCFYAALAAPAARGAELRAAEPAVHPREDLGGGFAEPAQPRREVARVQARTGEVVDLVDVELAQQPHQL